MQPTSEDRSFMAQALALAARVDGSISPNPRVGCVVVNAGVVVGAGLHRGPGSPHAEALAIAAAGRAAVDATVYVTLEPCAHQGRTPPCVAGLIRARVARVIAAIEDPDPRVDGAGFRQLREAGVQVEIGLLAGHAEALNAGFLRWHRTGRPLVTLKAGLSLDGQLAARAGESRWITSPAARLAAHRLRWSHDAILVGAGTVRRDDPRLTVRLDGRELRRTVAIVSKRLDLDPMSKVLCGADPQTTRIYTGASSSTSRADSFAGKATVVRVSECDTGIALDEVLADLGGIDVQSVLVEGGGRTIYRFLRQGIAHRGALFQAPRAIGAEGATPWLNGPAVDAPGDGWSFQRERVIPLGPDQLTLGSWRLSREGG